MNNEAVNTEIPEQEENNEVIALQQNNEVEKKLEEIEEWDKFLDRLDIYQKKPETVEIPEERKRELFFSPNYQPTIKDIEGRERQINSSEIKKVSFQKATEENNELLRLQSQKNDVEDDATPKLKGITLTARKSLDFIHLVTKGVPIESVKEINRLREERYKDIKDTRAIADIYNSIKKDNLTEESGIEDISMKALSRMKQLGHSYGEDVHLLNNKDLLDENRMSTQQQQEIVTSREIVTLAKIDDKQWDESINILKKIPYLEKTDLNISRIATRISNNYPISYKENIEFFENNPSFLSKESTPYNGFYDSLKSPFIDSLGSFINDSRNNLFEEQALLEIERATGEKPDTRTKDNMTFSYLCANWGLWENTLSPSMQKFLMSDTDKYVDNPKLLERKVDLIKKIRRIKSYEAGTQEIGDSKNLLFEYLTNPENSADIKGFLSFKDSGEPPKLGANSLELIHTVDFYHSDPSFPDKKTLLENSTNLHAKEFWEKFTTQSSDIKRLWLEEIKKNSFDYQNTPFTKLLNPLLRDKSLLEYNIRSFSQEISQLEDPDALSFWTFVMDNPIISTKQAEEIIGSSENGYRDFLQKHTSQVEENGSITNIPNFSFISEALKNFNLDEATKEKYKNLSSLSETDRAAIESCFKIKNSELRKQLLEFDEQRAIENPDALSFWTFVGDNPFISTKQLEEMKKSSENGYRDFLQKYTSQVEENGSITNIPNFSLLSEALKNFGFDERIKESYKNLSSLSETDRLIIEHCFKIEEGETRAQLLELYEQGFINEPEEIRGLLDLSSQINNSPSPEIKRLKESIYKHIFSKDTSLGEKQNSLQVIKNLFERNNSPTSIIRWKVFNELYLDKLVEQKFASKTSKVYTDILQNEEYDKETKAEMISDIIRKDLLKIAKDSVDENLYTFLERIQAGYSDLHSEKETEQDYSKKLEFTMKTLDLFLNAREEPLPKSLDSLTNQQAEEIRVKIQELRTFLGKESLQEGIYNRYIDALCTEVTGNPIQDIELILAEMRNKKEEAHNRGLEYAKEGKVTLKEGDLIKGITNFSEIINDGILARDFLGAGATQDATPFDTDTIMISENANKQSFSDTIQEEGVTPMMYGNIVLIFKDRGQFSRTGYDDKYELIESKVVGESHYGIRTGIPTTETDYILHTDTDKESYNWLKFEIASKGIYIPVVNLEGKIIFTPEEFEQRRETFAGVSGLRGKPFVVETKTERISEELRMIEIENKKDRERISEINTLIKEAIKKAVLESGIIKDSEILENSRTGLKGIRIENTGSTGRFTHVTGGGDFDFTLQLPTGILEKLTQDEVTKLIENTEYSIGIVLEKGQMTGMTGSSSLQLRKAILKTNTSHYGEQEIEFDLGIANKGKSISEDSSHAYVTDRLNNIRKKSEEEYNFVVSNIIYAKKFLKENGCYKKGSFGEGGLGGIGVENWILQHHGNFELAVEKFLEQSGVSSGQKLTFNDFKKKYAIYDPGKDIRTYKHDSFVENNMTSEGYEKMIAAFIKFKNQEKT